MDVETQPLLQKDNKNGTQRNTWTVILSFIAVGCVVLVGCGLFYRGKFITIIIETLKYVWLVNKICDWFRNMFELTNLFYF